MAKAFPPFPISGSVGQLTFYQSNGQTYVKQKNTPLRKRSDQWDAQRPRQRENRISFGGASMAACKIYTPLLQRPRGKARPYSHNWIASKLRRFAERTYRHVDHYTFRAAHSALQGLDLSNDNAQSHMLTLTAIGPHHQPTHLSIKGLQEAAKAIPIHGNAHLELRLQLKYIEFVETKFQDGEWRPLQREQHRKITPQTDWIPTEILPEEGLTLPLTGSCASNPDANILVFLLIEFREVRPVGRRIILHPTQTIIRLAAMQYSEATARDIATHKAKQAPAPPEEQDTLATARKDPKAYLETALSRLQGRPISLQAAQFPANPGDSEADPPG